MIGPPARPRLLLLTLQPGTIRRALSRHPCIAFVVKLCCLLLPSQMRSGPSLGYSQLNSHVGFNKGSTVIVGAINVRLGLFIVI
jgi:hypothetical protein